jgi:hypothetical protein
VVASHAAVCIFVRMIITSYLAMHGKKDLKKQWMRKRRTMKQKGLGGLMRNADPQIYGIDWNADDDPKKSKTVRPKNKPFCEFKGPFVGRKSVQAQLVCGERVSTEHGRHKPFCKNHVLENLYVQDLLLRYRLLDDKADRKKAKEAFKVLEAKWQEEYDALLETRPPII